MQRTEADSLLHFSLQALLDETHDFAEQPDTLA
jgi:hypothetical protein